MQKWKELKSISNKKIDGDFFNPGSSKAETASILINNKAVSVFKGDECLYHLLKVQSVQDNKSIFLICFIFHSPSLYSKKKIF